MRQILLDNRGSAAELALRLAWNAGLSREELYQLTWGDISLTERQLRLPDRTVPLAEEEARCLKDRAGTVRGQASEYLMVSDRNHTRMLPQSISRVARQALDRGGLTGFTLVDLRQDYVIRLLAEHDWPYVARISGTAVSTLYANYSAYYTRGKGVKLERSVSPRPDEARLWRLIESEGDSVPGLALWMAWRLELRMQELLDLTWDRVDLDHRRITLADRQVSFDGELADRLRRVRAARAPDSDPHVLLTPRAQKPYDFARLSRSLRTVLIQGGLEDVSFRDILLDARREQEDTAILRRAAERGCVTRNDVMDLLSLSKHQAHHRLAALVERGELVRVGVKCFPPGAVVPPEEQYAVLRDHLSAVGSAYRKELADLLGLDGSQCAAVLRRLTAEGRLVKNGQLYSLPEPERG